jgi:transposase InsO family protein
MIHLLILAVHLLATIAKLVRPGGVRAVVAESLLLKHQLLISSRARRRAPNLNSFDRFLLGLGSLFVPPSRIPKLAVILKPRTLFRFHEALKKCKYRWLFSSGGHRRPGPQGPSKELIDAIVEIKRRNPRVGCPRIAQQLAHAFGIDINKDIVRRVLAKHYRPEAGTDGPSWLSFIGHVKDSLWSVDLFRCESILLRSHWVMVVMDVFTRRIIGFGVERADLCGVSVCRMFNQIIAGKSLPRHLSSDHDPLFRFHRWLANLRILEVEEIKSIPSVPVSHPFVERLIGTVRREFLDHVLIWNAIDLERKLDEFRIYYNENRVHQSLSGSTPRERSGEPPPAHAVLDHYAWRHHCRGLFQMPIAAFPWDTVPKYLIRDNDRAFGGAFKARIRAMGIRDRPTSFRSPWQNGYVERLIGSIRRECTDHLIVFNAEHLRRILAKYVAYYNDVRTHVSLGKDAPCTRAIERFGDVVAHSILGGLHHRYARI